MNKFLFKYRKAAVIIFTVAFLLSGFSAQAQAQNGAVSGFARLTCPEKRWVIFHPFVAIRARNISREAVEITRSLKKDTLLDGNESGGQLDAFRHTYWMARLTQEIGWRRATSLGKAHENGNYRMYKKRKTEEGVVPDEPSGRMDFLNNDAGIELGKRFPDDTPEQLTSQVIQLILDGKLYIISTDSQGNFLDCKGEIIPEAEIKGKWENGKCVVKSNNRN